jgi:putative transposase
VIDEHIRKRLAIDVNHRIDADRVDRVATCLERLATERGVRAYVRFDHGPDFIALAVADSCWCNGTGTVSIRACPGRTPGASRSTAAYAMSTSTASSSSRFSRPRSSSGPDESTTMLPGLTSAHGWLTPVKFAEGWTNQHQLQLA